MFEGGVSEFYVLLKHAKESFHNTAIILDCDLATIVTHHNQPVFTKVCTAPAGHLSDFKISLSRRCEVVFLSRLICEICGGK